MMAGVIQRPGQQTSTSCPGPHGAADRDQNNEYMVDYPAGYHAHSVHGAEPDKFLRSIMLEAGECLNISALLPSKW